MKKVWVLFALGLFLGCTATHVAMLGSEKAYSPTDKVEILNAPPKRPYKEIAVLETDGAAGISEIQCFQGMAEKAKSIGADAIIMKSTNTAIDPGGGLVAASGGLRYSKTRGVAIKYTD